ncbi:MAG: hybrid sensor histidine kinase/response regulator [Calditrichia bacterium]
MRYRYNILAVDDEIFNLESIQRTFHNLYQVFTTTSPREALEIFRTENIHLIIADQRMPEISGVELLEQIKQISPHPIRMVLSAYTDIEYLIDAINRGEVYRYITKPWEPNDLKVTVQKALEHYQVMMDRQALTEALEQKNAELNSRNLSLKRALEDLEEAQNKLLEMERFSIIGRMAGMIIHDLKQPLDIIRSAAETMARVELDTRERIEFSDMIKFEVERFLEMIQQLLDYSRGTFSLDMQEMQLSDFWGIMENRVKNYLSNFEVNLRLIAPESDALIRVDWHQMQRALINLVRNAREAFRQDQQTEKPEIILSSAVRDDEVVLQVQDNGPGIPDEIREKLFNPFISGKKNSGIGLGLAIVKHIVEEHDGRVEFSTAPGKGTSFSIILKQLDKPAEKHDKL